MICEAILKIKSDAQVSVSGDDIDRIEWHDGNPTNITKEQIQAKIDETAYINNREKEYPSWQDQMDMLWHSIDENAELKQKYFAFYEAIKAVKAKYPK
jgi:hypothetical protein